MVCLPPCGTATRHTGTGSPWERLACGILDKSGLRRDLIDRRTDTWSLVYVLHGRGSFRIPPGAPVPLAPGDCFVRRPGVVHSTVLDPRSAWREAYIGIGPHLAAALHAAGWLQPGPPVWRWGLSDARIRRFAALRDGLAQATGRDIPGLAATALTLLTEALAAAPAEPQDDPLAQAAVLLGGDAPLAPTLVAHRIGLGYELFRRRFRARFGLAPAAWGRQRRLDRACALLTGSALPIAAIARQLGYANPFAFTNRFRDVLGIAPTAYRLRGR